MIFLSSKSEGEVDNENHNGENREYMIGAEMEQVYQTRFRKLRWVRLLNSIAECDPYRQMFQGIRVHCSNNH